MDNWARAKHELMYKIKRRAYSLTNGKIDPQALVVAERDLEGEIRLRAYSIYCVVKESDFDDWRLAENECGKDLDFYQKVENKSREVIDEKGHFFTRSEALKIAETRLKEEKAFLIWQFRNQIIHDWIYSEKSVNSEIEFLSKEFIKKEPYLSEEEAWYCARDQSYSIIKEKAQNRHKWIIERAFYIGEKNPSNSSYSNWCQAASEYDNESRHKWIAERAFCIGKENPNNSSQANWCTAANEYDSKFLTH